MKLNQILILHQQKLPMKMIERLIWNEEKKKQRRERDLAKRETEFAKEKNEFTKEKERLLKEIEELKLMLEIERQKGYQAKDKNNFQTKEN